MNPLLQQAIGSILRFALASIATRLVDKGIWTSNDAQNYVAAGVLAILTLAWSLWQKYKADIERRALTTAARIAGQTSEASVHT